MYFEKALSFCVGSRSIIRITTHNDNELAHDTAATHDIRPWCSETEGAIDVVSSDTDRR